MSATWEVGSGKGEGVAVAEGRTYEEERGGCGRKKRRDEEARRN